MTDQANPTTVPILIEIDAQGDLCGNGMNGAEPCDHWAMTAVRGAYCTLFGPALEVDDAAPDARTTYRRCASCLYAENVLALRLAAR